MPDIARTPPGVRTVQTILFPAEWTRKVREKGQSELPAQRSRTAEERMSSRVDQRRHRRRARPRLRGRPVAVPGEPRSAERQYLRFTRHVWAQAQAIISWALEPLLEVWDVSLDERVDADQDDIPLRLPGREAQTLEGLSATRGPFISAYPSRRRGTPRVQVTAGPLSVPRRLPRIWHLSDRDLQALWPNTDPADVRRFAPWATTRSEVARVALPAGSPLPEASELEARVQAAIRAERLSSRTPEDVTIVERRRLPGAFRLRFLEQINRESRPPVIFRPDGVPLGPPPRARRVTRQTITRSMAWAEMALGAIIREENLAPLLTRYGEQVSRYTSSELARVLKVDLRADIPGIQEQINQWRTANVNLIETGVRARQEAVKLRPSLLGDVSRTVEDLHAQGIRVEAVAGELQRRFKVSDSRAELIARDQTLKLNSQINRSRQRAVGIDRYQWVTSRDERVREAHAELDGSIQSWDAPPDVGDGRSEHPGGDYQCRCVAVPVPPRWLQE